MKYLVIKSQTTFEWVDLLTDDLKKAKEYARKQNETGKLTGTRFEIYRIMPIEEIPNDES